MSISKYRKTGVPVPWKSRQEVRKAAHYLRKICGEKYAMHNDKFPVTKVIEIWGSMFDNSNCNFSSNYPNYDVLPDHELLSCEASFNPDLKTFHIRESVWDSAELDDPESRETLAHELGHCVLQHPSVGLQRASNEFHTVVPETDSEYQANWFMTDLLIDPTSVEMGCSVDDLINRFCITRELAEHKIFEMMRERKDLKWKSRKKGY